MFNRLVLGASIVVFTMMSSSQASITWDLNASGASGGALSDINNIQEGLFLASSILGFRDGDGSGTITAGDTFTDYTVIRVTGFTSPGGGNPTPTDYGTGSGRTHELTAVMRFGGTQITGNSYNITSVSLMDWYFDFGAGYSGSDFLDLSTFVDSPLGAEVESGILGGPSGGVNSGPTAPDGTIDIILRLFDNLHNLVDDEYFELDHESGTPLELIPNVIVQGIVDANNLATPPGDSLGGLNAGDTIDGNSITTGFADLFGPAFGLAGTQAADVTITSLSDGDGAFDFAFQTRSDGSFVKELIPEPSSVVLWVGISTIVAASRRRRALS